jgi:hypothetical protein
MLVGGGIVALLIVAGIAVWLATKGGNSSSKSTAMNHNAAMNHNPIMQALIHANSDPGSNAKHFIPPSTCKASGASKVTCTNPHPEAYTATFTTYPTLRALYTAYQGQLNRLGDPRGFNWGACGPKGKGPRALNIAAGESGWNHLYQHPKQYSLMAAESGKLNGESQLGGRLFCTVPTGQNAESIVWTENAGQLLGVVSGPVHEVYDWWFRVHHNIELGPGMKMSGSGSGMKMSGSGSNKMSGP